MRERTHSRSARAAERVQGCGLGPGAGGPAEARRQCRPEVTRARACAPGHPVRLVHNSIIGQTEKFQNTTNRARPAQSGVYR